MAAATLATILAASDQSTWRARLIDGAATLGVDTIGVEAESVFRALYEMEAAWKAREDSLRIQIAQAGFLGTVKSACYDSDGAYIEPPNWVDLIAKGEFNRERHPAIATVGHGLLTASNLASAGTVPAMQARFVSSEATGNQRYRNKYAFRVVPGGAPTEVTLVADVAGAAGNVGPGDVTHLETNLAGCSFTNASSSSWIDTRGVDMEADDSLIARCFSRWGASSYGGVRSAYLEWITNAFVAAGLTPPVLRVGVDDANPNGPGSTDVYVANGMGPATLAELAIIDAFLQPRRGLGKGPLRFLPCPALTIPVVANIFGNSNGAVLGARTLLALEAIIGIGGTVHRSAVYAALSAPAIPGVVPPNGYVDLTAPLADVLLTGFQVPVFQITLTAK